MFLGLSMILARNKVWGEAPQRKMGGDTTVISVTLPTSCNSDHEWENDPTSNISSYVHECILNVPYVLALKSHTLRLQT